MLKAKSFWLGALVILAANFLTSVAHAQRPLGVDVSHYQGTGIVWPSVKSGGFSYAWAKATEGTVTAYNDDAFVVNMNNAKAANVIIGPYHFARYDMDTNLTGINSADSEADYFWNVAKAYVLNDGLTLSPMLDVEHAYTNNTLAGGATLSDWVNEWCNRLIADAASSGITLQPVIYTYTSYSTSYLNSTLTNRPLSMASYNGANPQSTGPATVPWSNWFNWQYSSTNSTPGVSGSCDVNVFNGTTNLLQAAMVVGNAPPTNTIVMAGSNALFSITAGSASASTLHFTWRSNNTVIAGQNTSTLNLSNIQPNFAGPYTVTVSNSATGAVYSETASLNVLTPLTNGPAAILAPTSLVNWWPGETTPNDIFASAKLTQFNNVTFTNGVVGKAFRFDGSASWLSNNAASLAVPWTFSVWVNRPANDTNTGSSMLGDGLAEVKLEQYNNTHQVGVTQFGVADNLFTPNYTVPLNTWTHLTFVGTSAGTSLYVNGVSNSFLALSFSLPRRYIGCGYAASSFKFVDFMLGSMDEMMIFNRALSAAEIAGIYGTGSSGLLREPEITNLASAGANKIKLSVEGITGKNYSIYSSTNLTTWKKLGTLANASGTNSYTDSTATSAQTFYRLSQP